MSKQRSKNKSESFIDFILILGLSLSTSYIASIFLIRVLAGGASWVF